MSEKIHIILNNEKERIAKSVYLKDITAHEMPQIKEKYIRDLVHTIENLAVAVEFNNTDLFKSYLLWLGELLVNYNFSLEGFKRVFSLLRDILNEEFSFDFDPYFERALVLIEKGHIQTPTFLNENNEFYGLAKKYLELLIDGNKDEAVSLITNRVNSGELPLKNLYVDIIQPSMYEVGRLWQKRDITVAQEHYITAVSQFLMMSFYSLIFATPKNGKKVLGLCVGSELHELGIRMISDYFEVNGWESIYLGANTPVEGIIGAIEMHKPDLLLASVSTPIYISDLKRLVESLKEKEISTKIMVGGRALNIASELWKKLGADGYSTDAIEALKIAEELIYD